MSTALVPVRPTLAELLDGHPDFEQEVAEMFVDLYVEIRSREPADADGADARARAQSVMEIYEHEAFSGIEEEEDLPPIPEDVIDRWLATAEDLTFQLAVERAKRAVADKVDTYATLRSEGKTVVQVARKIGDDPGLLVGIVDAKLDDEQRARIKAGRAARNEDDAARAFNGRRRLLSTLASKLTKEIETRDLSDVPADKLVGMLLKVCELSREEPPDMTVQGRIRSV